MSDRLSEEMYHISVSLVHLLLPATDESLHTKN